jgi:hypothetical protein
MVGLFPTEVGVLSIWDASSCVTNASWIKVGVMVGSTVNGTTGVDELVAIISGIGEEGVSIPPSGVGV